MFRSFCLILLISVVAINAVPVEEKATEDEVTFKYVTQYNKEGYYVKIKDLYKQSINVLKPVTFIIDGIYDADKGNHSWYTDLVDAYTERYIHNVFIVDWKIPSDSSKVKAATSAVGNAIAEFIEALYKKTGEVYLDIHLVGVVLGSEVAGIAGKRTEELTGKKVNRITALDPYYYLINDGVAHKASPDVRLSKENAKFVDVLHSNLNVLKEFEQLGHVDYYLSNKDCQQNNNTEITKKCRRDGVELFAKSVNSKATEAWKCSSLDDYTNGKCNNKENENIVFGEDAPKDVRGKYVVF